MHAFGHELFDVPFDIPIVVGFDRIPSGLVMARTDFDPIVVRQMTLTGNVGEQVRNITEIRLLWADTAVQWQLSICH